MNYVTNTWAMASNGGTLTFAMIESMKVFQLINTALGFTEGLDGVLDKM